MSPVVNCSLSLSLSLPLPLPSCPCSCSVRAFQRSNHSHPRLGSHRSTTIPSVGASALAPEKSDKVLVSPARKILSRFCHITKIDLSLGSGYEQVSGRRQQEGAIRLLSLHVPEMVGCEGGWSLSQLGDQEMIVSSHASPHYISWDLRM